jgi:hypothetical protein
MTTSSDGFRLSRRRILLGATALTAVALPLVQVLGAGRAAAGPRYPEPPRLPDPSRDPVRPFELTQPASRMFATVSIPYTEQLNTASDGDLWPSCWADDDQLYAANGDGRGFSGEPWQDIVVNRISGTPGSGITGRRLAAAGAVSPIWSDARQFSRKPTGFVAVDGNGDGRDELYLAVQDLRYAPEADAFQEAPAASVVRSTDYGVTWQATTAPLFTDHVFTTIFFLDFGKSNSGASVLGPDGANYVYAYGLDGNWRDSYTDTVPDPVDLYLARVPVGAIQDRARWEFFAGVGAGGAPRWSTDIGRRVAVLHDDRRVYATLRTDWARNCSVLSQGCVVYNAPLERYLYTSWTEYTFEFYEAPRPWGPWKLFGQKDFGPLPWWNATGDPNSPGPKNGGYATTIPSKFISPDGLSMWVQSNWFVQVGAGAPNYNFSLREMTVTPYRETVPVNLGDNRANLARAAGTVAIDKTSHYGKIAYLNDGRRDLTEDSWDGEQKTVDQWGYTWPRAYNVNRAVYTTGRMFPDGGWFTAADGGLKVQVRQNLSWRDVTGLTVDPGYPYDSSAGPGKTYTLTFDNTWGDGIRVTGHPGGSAAFTSIAELEVYFDG